MPKQIIAACQLLRYTRLTQVRNEKRKAATTGGEETALEKKKRKFMQAVFEEKDLSRLQRQIIDSARKGSYEIEVMDFPAAYCSDGGRAINNGEADWPDTLKGKAKSFYDVWQRHGKPNGYHLKVKVKSYPDGFIGTVGLYLDWSTCDIGKGAG